jgi:hypothetical protein
VTPADYPAVAAKNGMRILGILNITKADPPCMAFLKCANPATTTTPHPLLGDVPCCQRCHDRMIDLRNPA